MPDDAMPDDDMMGGAAGKKPAMGGMASKKPAMGMMDDDMMSGMKDMDMMEMMGMMGMAPKGGGGMGGTKSMATMQKKAALPNFPGTSHIYHVGATDFFLNHPQHIKLTPKQKGDLGRIKEKAVLVKTSAQRKIDEAEQELWTLTSSDEPDAAQIEGKIQEIAKLRGDQRIALIRAVGDAANLLTDEQRQALLGTAADETAKPDSNTTAKPDPHAGHKP
jgi:Spy/CpxP family protein refolding chaperone